MRNNTPKPTEIRVNKASQSIRVSFDDGAQFDLPAELLRVESPSAEVQGHGGDKKTVAGKRYVAITNLEPVGHYAIRILFDDGHDTGIYSWVYLYELGYHQSEFWARYERALADAGLDRDPFPERPELPERED